MSKLDNLYTFYRRYCKEIANHRNGSIMTSLVIWEDGSGKVETEIYLPTDSNPFNLITEEILRFTSLNEGAKKLEELVDGQKELSKGRKADQGKLDDSASESTGVA